MGKWTVDEIVKRAAAAFAKRAVIQNEIDQCMDFAMPWRRRQKGRDTFDRLYDSTGPVAVQRFGSKIQRDFTPPFQRWFKLECGPMVPTDQADGINRQLEIATDIIHAALDASAFPTASAECYSDLAIGTGALLATEGDQKQPIRWQSAPPWALGIEQGASGRIDNVYWEKDYPIWTLPYHWPGATWGEQLQEQIDKGSRAEVKILQASYYDDDTDGWRIAIVANSGDEKAIVWERERRSNPWIIPRWWTTSGDPWGRGPLMLALPDIKTGNKTVEMILRAAAYQLAPPLMVLNDGVVNPDQMRLAPSALIKVARTGGPMGRSIEPMDIGTKVDLAQIVLTDLRQGINKILLNEQLPPDSGAVRSASEIVEKAKQLQYDAGAAFGRLNHEFVPPVIMAVIDILDLMKVPLIKWDELRVDHFILKVTVTSPLARSQNLDDVQQDVQWLETMKAIGGDELVQLSAVIEDVGAELGAKMGVTRRLIRTKADRNALEAKMGQMAAQAANAQQQGSAQGPGGQPGPSGPSGQPSLAGGAQPAPFPTAPATLSIPGPAPAPSR